MSSRCRSPSNHRRRHQADPGDNLDAAENRGISKAFRGRLCTWSKQGKLAEARAIYDGILAEQPQAKRSLLEAGSVSFKLGELAQADDYLERLHEFVPDFPEAIELLIQINQALKRDVKVELLARDFRDLHDSGKNPELAQSLCFVRERIHLDQQDIVVSQFFDYTKDPDTVYMAEVFDVDGLLTRRLLLNYDSDTTRALRAKDAKYDGTAGLHLVRARGQGRASEGNRRLPANLRAARLPQIPQRDVRDSGQPAEADLLGAGRCGAGSRQSGRGLTFGDPGRDGRGQRGRSGKSGRGIGRRGGAGLSPAWNWPAQRTSGTNRLGTPKRRASSG